MIIRNEENRPFLYRAEFANALGSVTAGIMLSWAYEWTRMGSRYNRVNVAGEEYCQMTSADWMKKTGITYGMQVAARKKLREAGLFVEMRTGLPAVLVFRLDIDAANHIFSSLETDTAR